MAGIRGLIYSGIDTLELEAVRADLDNAMACFSYVHLETSIARSKI